MMKQRQLAGTIHHQSQTQLAQIMTLLLVVAALGQFTVFILGGDEGMEVGRVVDTGIQGEGFQTDQFSEDFFFDPG
jgi:hypothetical protein